jgi:hypothetical protein
MDGRTELPLFFQGASARPKMDVPRWAYMPPQRTAPAFSGAHSATIESIMDGRLETMRAVQNNRARSHEGRGARRANVEAHDR